MPFIIEDILPQSQQLISVKVSDAVQLALDLRIELAVIYASVIRHLSSK